MFSVFGEKGRWFGEIAQRKICAEEVKVRTRGEVCNAGCAVRLEWSGMEIVI